MTQRGSVEARFAAWRDRAASPFDRLVVAAIGTARWLRRWQREAAAAARCDERLAERVRLARSEGGLMRVPTLILSSVVAVVAVVALDPGRAAPAADAALFDPIASIVMHPRCINCHQDDSPRQTDRRIRHRPLVVRGADGHGAPTQPCQSCHPSTNTADGFVPGVADWHLAPAAMRWEGLTRAQICAQMKDPARNGGRRTGESVIEHMKTDPLVLWAWSPGGGRTRPPLAHGKFVEALEAWVRAGMPCPPGA